MSLYPLYSEEKGASTGKRCLPEEGVEGDNRDNFTGSILPSAIHDALCEELELDNAVLSSTTGSSLRVEAEKIDQLLSSPVAFMMYVRESKLWTWFGNQHDEKSPIRRKYEASDRTD
jgi:hypothetical protein